MMPTVSTFYITNNSWTQRNILMQTLKQYPPNYKLNKSFPNMGINRTFPLLSPQGKLGDAGDFAEKK